MRKSLNFIKAFLREGQIAAWMTQRVPPAFAGMIKYEALSKGEQVFWKHQD